MSDLNAHTWVTQAQLLKIKKPEELFSGDPDKDQKLFKELAKKYHPDVTHGKDEVFVHINMLYKAAQKKVADGTWAAPSTVTVSAFTSDITFKYLSYRELPFGKQYVGEDLLIYLVDTGSFTNHFNLSNTMNRFPYANAKMEKEISKCLPGKTEAVVLDDGQTMLTVYKSKDLLLLRDVVDYFDGKLDPKHIAWVLSTLYNLACYLSFAGVTHNDISLDSYFINPADHGGALFGSWWYAKKVGEYLKYIPARTATVLPWEVRTKKEALPITDLELIRLVGRELLGKQKAPKPMTKWLNAVSQGNAIEEYREWGSVLKESFGPRRFTELKLTSETLYGRK